MPTEQPESNAATEGTQDPAIEQRIRAIVKEQIAARTASAPEPPLAVNFTQESLREQGVVLTGIDASLVKIQAAVAVDQGTIDGDAVIEATSEARSLIKERFKRLQIAEQGSWAAVKRYDGAKQLGDNVEDAKYIQKCIEEARSERARPGYRNVAYRPRGYYRGYQNMASRIYSPYGGGRQRHPGSYAPRFGMETGPGNACHLCFEEGHWKNACPYNQPGFSGGAQRGGKRGV